MKTSPTARVIKKLRMITLSVGLGLIVVQLIPLSQTLAVRLNQIGAQPIGGSSAPNVDLGAILRAAH